MSKKIFAMFLAIVLVLGTLPVLAISSAAEATKTNVALGKTATAGNGNTFASITDGATSELADIGYWTRRLHHRGCRLGRHLLCRDRSG